MHILTKWDPLGERSAEIEDLDNYRTEAQDILFHLKFNLRGHSPVRIVQDVLNQAFHLSLTTEECRNPVEQIMNVVQMEKE